MATPPAHFPGGNCKFAQGSARGNEGRRLVRRVSVASGKGSVIRVIAHQIIQSVLIQSNAWLLKAFGGVSYNNVLVLVVADFAILVRASATMANFFFLVSGLKMKTARCVMT
jgi:hypothetical protein